MESGCDGSDGSDDWKPFTGAEFKIYGAALPVKEEGCNLTAASTEWKEKKQWEQLPVQHVIALPKDNELKRYNQIH